MFLIRRRFGRVWVFAICIVSVSAWFKWRSLYSPVASDEGNLSVENNVDVQSQLSSGGLPYPQGVSFYNLKHHLIQPESSYVYMGRQLLQSDSRPAKPNCTPPAIEQFPKPLFTQEQRKHGAIILHTLVTLYMFLGLAIICDSYFVPSLECICDVLKLQSDVAGATFMAAGSSAPELATAVIGTFIVQDDIGLGSVVGSAVFNIMFVISLCALFAGSVVYLSWWPLVRDCLSYTISILALVLVIMDGYIYWYEGLALLLLYFLYIVLMVFNPVLSRWFTSRIHFCDHKKPDPETELTSLQVNDSNYVHERPGQETEDEDFSDNPAADTQSLLPSSVDISNNNLRMNGSVPSVKVKTHLDEEDPHPLSLPQGWCKRILWVVALPLTLLFFLTVPDCRKPRWRRCFILTFIMSCVWISASSYVMIWMITIVGHTMGIPDTIMGLTFIAAGVSVPDAIASLLVVWDGYGDMAVSNAVGSNVFDILLCLGLPWFLKTTIVQPGVPITIYSSGLTYSSIMLLSTVILLLLATHLNKWRLTKPYGIVLIVIYVVFLAVASLYELNIFGNFHPPECLSQY